MDVCDAAAEKGIKCLITGYAFSLPAGAAERYDILLKPLRPAEITWAVEIDWADLPSLPVVL